MTDFLQSFFPQLSLNKMAMVRILIVSLGLGLASFATQDRLHFSELFAAKAANIAPSEPVQLETITLVQALQFFYSPGTIFLDVRDKQYYDYGHIEGAINVPVDQINSIQGALLQKLTDGTSVVVYCNGSSCQSSYVAARSLIDKGLDNVRIYTGGWPEWNSCHQPIVMSEEMKNDLAKTRAKEKK